VGCNDQCDGVGYEAIRQRCIVKEQTVVDGAVQKIERDIYVEVSG
jgi:hypothetical protein